MSDNLQVYDIDLSYTCPDQHRIFKSIHDACISDDNYLDISNKIIPKYWLDIFDIKGTFYDPIYKIDFLGYKTRDKNQQPLLVSYNVE